MISKRDLLRFKDAVLKVEAPVSLLQVIETMDVIEGLRQGEYEPDEIALSDIERTITALYAFGGVAETIVFDDEEEEGEYE